MCIKFAPQHVPTFSPSANLYPRRPSVGLWLWWEAALSQMDQGRWCCVRCWICWITILHANREVPWWQKCVKLRYEIAACPSMAGFHSYSYFSFSIYLSALRSYLSVAFQIFFEATSSQYQCGVITLPCRSGLRLPALGRQRGHGGGARYRGDLRWPPVSWIMQGGHEWCAPEWRCRLEGKKRELSLHFKAWGNPHS